jgi:hypothetical protein
MNEFRLITLAREAANGGLAIALLCGAMLLARRSIPAATWLALAGFFSAATGVYATAVERVFVVHYGMSLEVLSFIDVVHVVSELGFIALAIRALPARAR